jgi:hypothetical protein
MKQPTQTIQENKWHNESDASQSSQVQQKDTDQPGNNKPQTVEENGHPWLIAAANYQHLTSQVKKDIELLTQSENNQDTDDEDCTPPAPIKPQTLEGHPWLIAAAYYEQQRTQVKKDIEQLTETGNNKDTNPPAQMLINKPLDPEEERRKEMRKAIDDVIQSIMKNEFLFTNPDTDQHCTNKQPTENIQEIHEPTEQIKGGNNKPTENIQEQKNKP